MKRYTKSQLNAISRSITKRENKKAEVELFNRYHVRFEEFKRVTGYRASAVRLLGSLDHNEERTLERLDQYRYYERTGGVK